MSRDESQAGGARRPPPPGRKEWAEGRSEMGAKHETTNKQENQNKLMTRKHAFPIRCFFFSFSSVFFGVQESLFCLERALGALCPFPTYPTPASCQMSITAPALPCLSISFLLMGVDSSSARDGALAWPCFSAAPRAPHQNRRPTPISPFDTTPSPSSPPSPSGFRRVCI